MSCIPSCSYDIVFMSFGLQLIPNTDLALSSCIESPSPMVSLLSPPGLKYPNHNFINFINRSTNIWLMLMLTSVTLRSVRLTLRLTVVLRF